MTAHWRFNEIRPGDRTRESQVEKFFKTGGHAADPVVREGIQNSLDAAPDDKVVRVRLAIGAVLGQPTQSEMWKRGVKVGHRFV